MELFTEQHGARQQTSSWTKLIISGKALESSIIEFHYHWDVNSTFLTSSHVFRIFSMWIFKNKLTIGRLGFRYEKWAPQNMINIPTTFYRDTHGIVVSQKEWWPWNWFLVSTPHSSMLGSTVKISQNVTQSISRHLQAPLIRNVSVLKFYPSPMNCTERINK